MRYYPAGGASKLQRNIARPADTATASELLQLSAQRHVRDRNVRIEISVKRSLVKEFDKFCSENLKTRSELTELAWRALLTAANSLVYRDLRPVPREASKD